jgi:hypothetical protein
MPLLSLIYDSGGQAGFNHPCARSASLPDSGRAQASSQSTQSLSVADRLYQHWGLFKWRHLLPGMTGHGQKSPCAPGSMYSSAGIHPIAI